MISRSQTLHQLWTGVAGLPRGEGARAFDAALGALCPARREVIELDCPAGEARVLLDDTEVMPMVSVGDVVAEEFDLSLPYGTLLVFVPREELADDVPTARRAAAIGRICGQIISEAVHRGAFPFDREARIAGALTAGCLGRARALGLGGADADRAFKGALMEAVRDVLDPAAPLAAPAGCPVAAGLETLARRVDAAAEAAGIGFDAWLEAIHTATCGRRKAPGERADICHALFAAAPPPGLGPRGHA